MPVSLANLFRALIVVILAAWAFVMYCLARTDGNAFGLTAGRGILSVLFALVMLVPLVWAVAIPDLPEILGRDVRGQRRWRRHLCPSCAYPLAADSERCAECGTIAGAPERYRITKRTLVRFAVINLLAWFIGCAVGEAWVHQDEQTFLREADRALANTQLPYYCRARRWPNDSVRVCVRPGDGVMTAEELDRRLTAEYLVLRQGVAGD